MRRSGRPAPALRPWLAATVAVAVAAIGLTVLILRRPEPPGHPTGAERSDQPGGAKIVGYYFGRGAEHRDYHVKHIHTSGSAAKLSHLVYAFGEVVDGRCASSSPEIDYQRRYPAADSVDGAADPADPEALRGSFGQLRKLKARYPDLKLLWSFGGWDGSAGFPAALNDPAAFAESCHDLVEDPRWAGVFDGIDLDWEYPNACGESCDDSGADDGYSRLVTAIRERFGPQALVTSAITADAGSGGKLEAADYAAARNQLDWYMVMTYDFFGAWREKGPTAAHAALAGYPGIPRPEATARTAIRYLRDRGVPAAKLLLGIPFYGRGWTGVRSSAPGGSATGPAAGRFEPGIEDYRTLKTSCPATDTAGGTAYAVCGDEWWSYDTPATIRAKMRYVRAERLGGAFLWELAGDTADGELISAIRAGLD